MTAVTTQQLHGTQTAFLGLAPFLRNSIAGFDLLTVAKESLARVTESPDDPCLLMNASIAMQCIGHRELGLAFQSQALELIRVYTIHSHEQPVQLSILMLMVPGDIAANTPLECLLESSDIDLIHYYVTPGDLLASKIPDHDVLLVAMGESQDNRELLNLLEHQLAHWPKPVINQPQFLPATDRHVLSELLRDAPGLLIARTKRTQRKSLMEVASGNQTLSDINAEFAFPVILRPVDSQAGRDLSKLETASELAAYLANVEGEEFFLSQFVNYSSADGYFRKYRVAMIDGVPFACHMGVSSHWMVHYVNAGMYEDASKRAEEECFMATFDAFALRHKDALTAVHRRIGLDYLCIDCAETQDGRLLVFEIDNCMVVHAMDPESLFPYKQFHMQKVKHAFRNFVMRLNEASR